MNEYTLYSIPYRIFTYAVFATILFAPGSEPTLDRVSAIPAIADAATRGLNPFLFYL
jgi:hypothetical protein